VIGIGGPQRLFILEDSQRVEPVYRLYHDSPARENIASRRPPFLFTLFIGSEQQTWNPSDLAVHKNHSAVCLDYL